MIFIIIILNIYINITEELEYLIEECVPWASANRVPDYYRRETLLIEMLASYKLIGFFSVLALAAKLVTKKIDMIFIDDYDDQRSRCEMIASYDGDIDEFHLIN